MLRLHDRVVRVAVLMVLACAGISAQSATAKKVVHVVAERFSFTPSHISVAAGTVIEIRLTSEDTAHGFRIAGPRGVDVTIPKRGRGEMVVTFEATEAGDYVFECSRMCGAGHSFMRGRIRVRP
jgi:cytochrome c oxidase subunit 2